MFESEKRPDTDPLVLWWGVPPTPLPTSTYLYQPLPILSLSHNITLTTNQPPQHTQHKHAHKHAHTHAHTHARTHARRYNGGPPCSSLLGGFGENGPFRVGQNGLALNPTRWDWGGVVLRTLSLHTNDDPNNPRKPQETLCTLRTQRRTRTEPTRTPNEAHNEPQVPP